jgi:hypothetical protein
MLEGIVTKFPEQLCRGKGTEEHGNETNPTFPVTVVGSGGFRNGLGGGLNYCKL